MNTVIETFLVEETQELIHDGDKLSEWNSKVKELGLNGQEKIVSKDKSPIPFLPMKTSLTSTLEVLCPQKVRVEDYSISPIPLEILKLVSLSKTEQYFQEIEIWYDDVKPDPVCVGKTGYWSELQYYTGANTSLKDRKFSSQQECKDAGASHPYFYETQKYLIGKWGDVRRSFDELKVMAKARFIEEKSTELKTKIRDFQRQLEDVELEAARKF